MHICLVGKLSMLGTFMESVRHTLSDENDLDIVEFNKVLRTIFSTFMGCGPISGQGFTSGIGSGEWPDFKIVKFLGAGVARPV